MFWEGGVGVFCFFEKYKIGPNNGYFSIGIQKMTNYFSKNAIWKIDLAVLYLLFCQVKKKAFKEEKNSVNIDICFLPVIE